MSRTLARERFFQKQEKEAAERTFAVHRPGADAVEWLPLEETLAALRDGAFVGPSTWPRRERRRAA